MPEVSSAIEEGRCLIGTLDTWIIWNLTGGLNGRWRVENVGWVCIRRESGVGGVGGGNRGILSR